MPTMPNVVGLNIESAELSLTNSGVLDQNSIGYFGTWPITAEWQTSNQSPSVVIAQAPDPDATVAVNTSITLTVAGFPVGVVYP